ncbi:hypothetical protein D3C78_1674080 [compost metagenome]
MLFRMSRILSLSSPVKVMLNTPVSLPFSVTLRLPCRLLIIPSIENLDTVNLPPSAALMSLTIIVTPFLVSICPTSPRALNPASLVSWYCFGPRTSSVKTWSPAPFGSSKVVTLTMSF